MYDLELSAKGVTVKLNAAFVGKDLLVWLTGGQAHIGAVALAVPRSSLKGGEKISADASVLAVSGHKEDLLARKIALALAAKLNIPVCVTAGLHWDAATPTRIETATELSGRLTKALLMHISKDKEEKAPPSESVAYKADLTAEHGAETAAPAAQHPAPEVPRAKPLARPDIKTAPRPVPPGMRASMAPARPVRPKAVSPIKNMADNHGDLEDIIIIDDDDTVSTAPVTRPAAVKPQGQPVSRDAQGRSPAVRQVANPAFKKPLLNKP